MSDSDKKLFQNLLENVRRTGKLSVADLRSLKDSQVCTCKPEDKPIFINPVVFTRQSELKPYHVSYKGAQKGKGKGFKKGDNFHKDNYHHGKGRRSHYDRPGGNGFARKKVSEKVKEMKDKAEKWKDILSNADKTDIEKQAKALLNKITPDNMKKLRDQIKDLLIGCDSAEDRKKFVKVFFKKATHEDKYCSMYTNLIKYIGESEYDRMADDTPTPTPTGKDLTKIQKAKESPFKKDLVEECKAVLKEFANEMKAEEGSELDKEDFEYRYKKRLFGNLKFIAELYKKKLVGPGVALHVLGNLLGLSEPFNYNNFTIEGACTFLTKVGEKLDKAKKIQEQKEAAEKEGDSKSKSKKKSKGKQTSSTEKNQEIFEAVVDRMTEFMKNQEIDSRIRIIIQNTLDRRENDWVENIQDEGPKTKKQIKKDHLRELQGLDQEEANAKKSPKAKKQPSKGTVFSELSMQKLTSTTTIASEYNEESDKEEEKKVKEYSPREREHMDHEAIKDRFIGNFVEWLGSGEFDLSLFDKPENKCSGDKVVELLLDKLYDKEEEEVKKFEEYFLALFHKKLFSKQDIEKGISSFFVTIPNIESDFPHLPHLFSDLLHFIFIEKNIADFSRVEIKLVGDNGKHL